MHSFCCPPRRRLATRRLGLLVALASPVALLPSTDAHAGGEPTPISARILMQTGDTPMGGAAVESINVPYVNALGEAAYVGTLDDGDHFVAIDDAVIWFGSDDAAQVLDGIEFAMDTNGMGNFVYAVDIDGLDGLYTDMGALVATGDPAPGVDGATFSFLSSPSMTADGSIYWVAGLDLDDDGATDTRAFYRTPDGTIASAELLLLGGDDLDGLTLDTNTTGINFSYAVSEDDAHRINVVNFTEPTDRDAAVTVDDLIVSRELDPTGDGDNFDAFDLVGINAAGNYVFTGDTDGDSSTDEFVAYNGAIAVREGDTVADVTLPDGATLRYVGISDFEQAVHAWGYDTPDGFRETVFFACDAADIAGTSYEVFTTVEAEIDIDDDGMADFTIADIPLTSAVDSRALGETPFIYTQVVLDDGMAQTTAMLEVPVSCCGNGSIDPFEDCDDGNDDETDDCISTCVAASCGDGFVQDGVEECDDGNDDDTDDCPTSCVPASCGDGFVQDGVDECDDGNDDDTDDCLSTCAAATCGDGFTQSGVEECDDGNRVDGDDCNNDCTLPSGSDGIDDTAGDTDSATSGTGGGTGPSTLSQSGADGSGTGDAETDTDANTAGGVGDDSSCSCRSGEPRLPGVVWSVFGLGLLAAGRRRR